MAMIPQEVINDIQNKANIVDVISSFGINFEKKGANYICFCPFHEHNYNTPSMSVNLEKGIYTCFSCHATGGVFKFVQEFQNISFVEAVHMVAELSGVKLDDNYKANTKFDKHYDAVELAYKFYQNNLRTEDGAQAVKYLKKRGINDEIIDEFGIGYAPNKPDVITQLLLNKGFDENILLDTGLSNRGNSLYDLFRNRITFPIHNPNGKPVGFSARIFDNSDEAKYINTRETPIFKKGEILFNYHRAQNEARRTKSILIVEGQLDAIRIYASGIKNVVATMGTAFTKDHIKLLKKLNVKIILCMDNDEAGEKATLSIGEDLQKEEIPTTILRLTGFKDPDEYILNNGVDAFKEAMEHAMSFFDFKLTYLKKNKNLEKAEDIAKYVNSVLNELSKSDDDILIEATINKLASDYNLNKNTLLNKVSKVEKVNVVKIEAKPQVKLSKNLKLCEILLYYMLDDIKYIKLYEQELSYIPDQKYLEIANDILAFYLKYNYISIADFITYEISSNHYEDVLSIINNNINVELNDADYVGIIEKIKTWIDENRIVELKERLKNETDINQQLKLADEIAKLKKRMCRNEESNRN